MGKNEKFKNEILTGQNLFGLSRRSFLYYCGGLAGSLALMGCGGDKDAKKVAKTLTAAAGKPPVIWLQGQDCTGCSISLLNTETPSASELILDTISLRYHEAVMAGSGHVSEQVLADTIKEGGYVLVVEGSIPKADDRFCMIGGKPFKDILLECARDAAAIIAVGSCASFGGIPAASPSLGMPVSHFVKNKPIINLPHCPVHHEHLVTTIVYYLEEKSVPELDKLGRPKLFFSKLVHDQCSRKEAYDNNKFLSDWNDPKQAGWCLADKGCKGTEAYSE